MQLYPYPLVDPLPPLSDEAAALLHEFLCEFLYQFEAAYYGQIRRYLAQESDDPASTQLDLFTNPDDPPF
jgi:hypothetical protein